MHFWPVSLSAYDYRNRKNTPFSNPSVDSYNSIYKKSSIWRDTANCYFSGPIYFIFQSLSDLPKLEKNATG